MASVDHQSSISRARVLTAAATIMVFVFGSFILNGDPTVQQFGVGLAVAALLDATVVRCLLVPAPMILMGKINWYMPAWLDPIVPSVSATPGVERATGHRAGQPAADGLGPEAPACSSP